MEHLDPMDQDPGHNTGFFNNFSLSYMPIEVILYFVSVQVLLSHVFLQYLFAQPEIQVSTCFYMFPEVNFVYARLLGYVKRNCDEKRKEFNPVKSPLTHSIY